MSRPGAWNRNATMAVVLATLSIVGCSADDDDDRGDGPGAHAGKGANGSSGAGGDTGFSNANTGGRGNAGASGSGPDASTVDPGTNDCVGEKQDANPVPVDMYIMLDRSDSMRVLTGAGPSKWDAMRSALTSFITDPESDGLGVGLQYFPLGAPGIPEVCNANAECGAADAVCTNRVCQPGPFVTSFVPTVCFSDADCPLTSPGCAVLGVCSLDDTLACFDIGPGACQQDGDCMQLPGECSNYATCETSSYSDPAVAIDALPDNAQLLTDSLMNETPIGQTPTPAALSGAIERAAVHAADNPTHRVITVLATDGLPSVCVEPGVMTVDQAVEAVAGIAAAGLARTPSVDTYVIGVFSPDDPDPKTKLDAIAAAGGTGQAFIVDASQDVAQQLIDALAKIRGGSLDCEFQLPDAPKGASLDYKLVNVEVTSNGAPQDLFYVGSADGCDKALFGWYYDADPEQGGTPTQIRVCEKTCDQFHSLPNASIEIKLGCATRGPD